MTSVSSELRSPAPGILPGFRETIVDYCDTLERLAQKMVRLYARALDLPAEYFDGPFRDCQYSLRMTHYPHQDGPVEERLVWRLEDFETVQVRSFYSALDTHVALLVGHSLYTACVTTVSSTREAPGASVRNEGNLPIQILAVSIPFGRSLPVDVDQLGLARFGPAFHD